VTGEAPFSELLAGHLEGESLLRMVRYAELLETWSARHNLIRFADRRELVERHLLDALSGIHLLEGRGTLLDVGSGAGLPGVPLLVARPGWRGVLLEPRQKRWAFLKTVIRELGLDAEAVDRRYEELATDQTFDLVTMRAVGGHAAVLDWARPRLVAGGGVALWTTQEGERAVAEKRGWRVLSWPAVGLDRGRLVYLEPLMSDVAG
jgi:16S rRNA (guanine527-N7)-methyltransferase